MNYKQKLKDLKRNEMPPLYEALGYKPDSARVMLSKFRKGKLSGEKQAEFEMIIDEVHSQRVMCRNIGHLEFDSKGVIVELNNMPSVYLEYTKIIKFKIELEKVEIDVFDTDYMIDDAREGVLKLGFENRDSLKLLIAKIILDD